MCRCVHFYLTVLRVSGGVRTDLVRCWIQFRERAGGSQKGISCAEFQRGLTMYGLKLQPGVSAAWFKKLDHNHDGWVFGP